MITRNLFKRLSKFNNKRAFSVARFETLDDSIATIDLEAPLFHVVLVNEEWHPQAEEASQHLQQISEQFYGTAACYEVAGDKDTRFAKYYSAKHVPEFLICAYGQDIRRHVGINYDSLVEKIQKTLDWTLQNDMPDDVKNYMPYDTSYKMVRIEYEREMQQGKL